MASWTWRKEEFPGVKKVGYVEAEGQDSKA
jgi:hypothetical protein